MALEYVPLSLSLTERHLDSLILIDRDTLATPWTGVEFLQEAPGKWSCSWLAHENGRAYGFLIASEKPRSVHIHRVAVDPERRSAGIGARLIALAAEAAAERKKPLTLKVSHENTRAQKLYERLGFDSVEDSTHNRLMQADPETVLSHIRAQSLAVPSRSLPE